MDVHIYISTLGSVREVSHHKNPCVYVSYRNDDFMTATVANRNHTNVFRRKSKQKK